MAPNLKLNVLRTIVRNLKETNQTRKIWENPSVTYIMKEYKKNYVTDAQYCRQQNEKIYLANTYATYLNSSKRYKALYEEYRRQEATVEQAANIVGFKLPEDPTK